MAISKIIFIILEKNTSCSLLIYLVGEDGGIALFEAKYGDSEITEFIPETR